jgi:hypothetical protein
MAADGPAFVAAAIRAACLAKAPRRTVQAVAAAVTSVFANVATASASTRAHDRQPPAATSAKAGAADDDASPEALLEALRAARRKQRQRKKYLRRAAQAAAKATSAASDGGVGVLQLGAVRAPAPHDVAVGDIDIGTVHGTRKPKRRKKGSGASGGRGGGGSSGDYLSLGVGAEVLQCDTVRASAPMDISVAEELNDYWADYASDDVFMKFVVMKYEGLHLDAIVEHLAKLKGFLVAACSATGGHRGGSVAMAEAALREFKGSLGFSEDPHLAAVCRRDG